MCAQAKVEPQLIYDIHAKRAWLIPKLSVMLHMAHAWAREFTTLTPIPFAQASSDGGESALAAIKDNSNLVIGDLGDHQGASLKDLMTFLWQNLNLQQTIRKSKVASTIYGFDFMDLVTSPKAIKLRSHSIGDTRIGWTDILDVIDGIIFVANSGDAVIPVHGNTLSNSIWPTVPTGRNYLTTTVLCLQYVLKRHGKEVQLENFVRSLKMDFPLDKLPACQCGNNAATCNPLQEVVNVSRNRLKKAQENKVSWHLCERGAVIFA